MIEHQLEKFFTYIDDLYKTGNLSFSTQGGNLVDEECVA